MRNPYPRTAQAKTATPGMARVPVQYKLAMGFKYPCDNTLEFERWYMNTYQQAERRDRLYLPVMWTAYYCSNGWGKKAGPLATMQTFVDSLPRTERYYTICQFDDGPMVDFKDLDIVVFGMAGGRVDYQIPLLCQPHAHINKSNRDITASFIGRITHACRAGVLALSGRPGYYVTDKDHSITQYTAIMQRSVFSLCPRGYSATSFRIMESLHAASIPVYYSDQFLLPYGLPFDYGVCVKAGEDIVNALCYADILRVQERMNEVKHLYTYNGCKQKILEELKSM